MKLQFGGSPPLAEYLRCDVGPTHATCDDRKTVLEDIVRRIGDLYGVEDRESILIDHGHVAALLRHACLRSQWKRSVGLELRRMRDAYVRNEHSRDVRMTKFYNGNFDEDPLDAFRAAIERCDKLCDDFAAQVHASEKLCFIDVGEAGGTCEEAESLSDELKKRGCDTFVQDARIYAWGDAFKKAMACKVLEPLPIETLPRDPEVEKTIWMWQSSLPWER